MPSPFPGMDPYLEDPGLWPDVHHRIISIASEMLTSRLRPKYIARIEERVYVSDENDSGRTTRFPDVQIVPRLGWEDEPFRTEGAGGVAVDVAEPIVATTLIEDEIHEARIEIIDREGRQVVTVIEVLSPTNKVAGSAGRESFEQKRQEVMRSSTHWVEIDLLRGGAPVRIREAIPPCEYLVHVSRKGTRPKGALWPIRLSQRLPTIPIPLRPGDDDAPLDLGAVLATAYDRAGYDLEVDYKREAVPPLPAPWAEWVDRLLREKGLR